MSPAFNTSQGKNHFRNIHACYLTKCDHILEYIVSIFILLCVVIPLLQICVSVVLFFFLLRHFVIMIATFLHNDTLVKPMEIYNALYACSDDIFGSPINTPVMGMVLQGVLDVAKVRNTVRERCLLKKDDNGEPIYPELMQSVQYFCGYPFFKKISCECEDEILEKLVRVCEPTDGGAWDRDSVQRFIKKFTFSPFARELPLWEILILPNYQANPELEDFVDPNQQHCFLLLRMHHSLADGISIVTLCECFSTVIPEVPYSAKWEGQRLIPSGGFAAVRWITQGVCELPLFLLKAQYVGGQGSLWRNECSDRNVPECDLLVTSWPRHVDMKDIRSIRLNHGVSGTSVIICAYLRSIRQLLLLRENKTLPSEVQFWISLPFPRYNSHLQNATTTGVISIPFDVSNAVQHLREVDIVFKQRQKSFQPILFYLLLTLLGLFPREILRLAGSSGSNATDFVALSSIPGPVTFTEIFGQPIKSLLAQTGIMRDHRGSLAFLFSLGGRAYLNAMAGSHVIPNDTDMQEVVNGFLIELEKLKQSDEDEYSSVEATAQLLMNV